MLVSTPLLFWTIRSWKRCLALFLTLALLRYFLFEFFRVLYWWFIFFNLVWIDILVSDHAILDYNIASGQKVKRKFNCFSAVISVLFSQDNQTEVQPKENSMADLKLELGDDAYDQAVLVFTVSFFLTHLIVLVLIFYHHLIWTSQRGTIFYQNLGS